ncbi:NAD-dependent epimerase/dehydratase family protein [Sinorhizobium meliloti]|nr:NAD(P)-dependent oxidoreductase [Sinorhizobium meliloti]MDW9592866.1 NAD-dependent epimerase/dehydratase family protein [Sinorhizobium meliloti]MDX0187633.1 NAD-dependent epimerase/dehydratase family protein [Sinorhizobium meliloti]MQV09170.1 NAD-dependent epimerase/dehydratase family protein [Sinorhizobium meliloti]MQV63340.1 NAD-dependent epimerase/dehydratase family protein [Sinorhizobium meliloti]
MREVLLTGASGFLGRPIPKFLIDSGARVHTIGRTPWSGRSDAVQFHKMDLLSPDGDAFGRASEIGADTLIHTAWCTEPGVYWNSIDNLRWMAASLQLVDAFLRGGGKRVVVVGTCAEYDWRYHTLVERETPLMPSTLYGQAKASLHKTLECYAKQHGISFAWAHVFFPYGPHEKRRRLLSDLIVNLLTGREMPVSEGRQIRDFLHVEDAAAAIAGLAESSVQGPVNIGSGDAKSLRDVIEIVAKETGRPELVRYGGRSPISNDPPSLAASVNRLRDEVGFLPRYGLELGLKSTVDWWRSELKAASI